MLLCSSECTRLLFPRNARPPPRSSLTIHSWSTSIFFLSQIFLHLPVPPPPFSTILFRVLLTQRPALLPEIPHNFLLFFLDSLQDSDPQSHFSLPLLPSPPLTIVPLFFTPLLFTALAFPKIHSNMCACRCFPRGQSPALL